MPKKIFEDMVQAKRERQGIYAIKEEVVRITPPIHRKSSSRVDAPKVSKKKEASVSEDKHISSEFRDSPTKKKTKHRLWLVAVVAIIILFFAVSSFFAKASVTLNPKKQDISINHNFVAIKDSKDPNVLSFGLMSLSGEEIRMVQDVIERDVSERALGTVVLYNNFSSAPQKLAIDTRLEGTNGKIYKTEKELVVPGMSKKDGQDVPGSIEVGIYASEPGAEYNSGPLDFKIFGFKGTSKYEKFYARSKGSISGGMAGRFKVVPNEEKILIVNELEVSLKEKLIQKAIEQLPEDFILFKDAVIVKVDSSDTGAPSLSGEVPVVVKATLYGFLFKENELVNKISSSVAKITEEDNLFIPGLEEMVFQMEQKDIDPKEITSINFKLTGDSSLVWRLDEESFMDDLLGKSKKEFKTLVSEYKNIDSAGLVVRPIWRTALPKEPKDIRIEVNYPN